MNPFLIYFHQKEIKRFLLFYLVLISTYFLYLLDRQFQVSIQSRARHLNYLNFQFFVKLVQILAAMLLTLLPIFYFQIVRFFRFGSTGIITLIIIFLITLVNLQFNLVFVIDLCFFAIILNFLIVLFYFVLAYLNQSVLVVNLF